MSDLTFAEVGQILRLLETIEGSDVELEWGDLRLRVRHGGENAPGPEVTPSSAAPAVVTGAESTPVEPATPAATQPVREPAVPERSASGEPGGVPEHWVAVECPMVGTFYRSPKPGEPAYVEVGDVVSAGDTVALVEVMKLFTELKAEAAGKVARIDAADAALVEFGQPLLWIEPA